MIIIITFWLRAVVLPSCVSWCSPFLSVIAPDVLSPLIGPLALLVSLCSFSCSFSPSCVIPSVSLFYAYYCAYYCARCCAHFRTPRCELGGCWVGTSGGLGTRPLQTCVWHSHATPIAGRYSSCSHFLLLCIIHVSQGGGYALQWINRWQTETDGLYFQNNLTLSGFFKREWAPHAGEPRHAKVRYLAHTSTHTLGV